MVFDGNGEAVDWILGYDPPADSFRDQLDGILKGGNTFQALARNFAETAFKVAKKYADRYDIAKAAEFYKQVLAIDPDGTKGGSDYNGEQTSYAQQAEFGIAGNALSARPPDRAPMEAFIKKYAKGKIVEEAFMRLSRSHYGRTATKEEAAEFYADYVGRFPDSVPALSAYVQRILQDKEPVEKGIELALKAVELQKAAAQAGGVPATPMGGGSMLAFNLARLYNLKGDKAAALKTVDAAAKELGGNPRMLSQAAQTYLDIGAEAKALDIYGPKFLKANMADASVLGQYAGFWTRQEKNLKSALEAAKKAVELTPAAPAAWLSLGNVHIKLKNKAEALKAVDKATEVAPANQKAMIQRSADQAKKLIDAIK
ncbi:MAG: tetratricopeptide repeat protein [Candidatus Aminicenantes bacterium]|nr:tetratricopeptide repeat protein [Candidatus Aminicenantes bacterium]